MNQPQKKMRAHFLNGLDENRGILGLDILGFFSGFGGECDLSCFLLNCHCWCTLLSPLPVYSICLVAVGALFVQDDHFSQFLLLSSPFVKLREIP